MMLVWGRCEKTIFCSECSAHSSWCWHHCVVAIPGLDGMQLVRVLGEGSRGVSYLVATPDDIGVAAPVVVATVLRPASSGFNGGMADRLTAVKHRLVRAVLDVRRDDDVDVVLSEYVEGGSLAQPMGPSSFDDAIRALTDVGKALGVWHDAGEVHGAVHINNVLLTTSGAVLADRALAPNDDVLPVGPLTSTLHCRAPELLRGERPSATSDVWAYGALLHRALTGRHVYAEVYSDDRLDAVNAALGQPLMMHGPLLPVHAALIARCLDADSGRRPTSVRDVADELALTIEGGSQ